MASTLVFGFFNNEMKFADEQTCVVSSNSKERLIVFSIIDDIHEYFDQIILHSDDIEDLPILQDVHSLLKKKNKCATFSEYCTYYMPFLNNLTGGGGVTEKSKEPEADRSVVYMKSDDTLSIQKLMEILREPEQSMLSTIPPMRPKGGELYVYSHDGDISKIHDWSCDGYQWVNKNGHPLPKKEPVLWRKTYYISTSKGDTLGNNVFVRSMYVIKGDQNPLYRIVHYIGNETMYYPHPHGNSKEEKGDYHRTLPSTINAIKAEPTNAPSKVYKKMIANSSVSGPYQGVKNPRNTNQVKMAQKNQRKKNKIHQDEIYSCLELAYHLEEFIDEIGIYPDLRIIFSLKDLTYELNKLLKTKSDEPVVISYDTTFDLGDFYLSLMVARHILFKGGRTIPVAFMLHDRKSQIHHDHFWQTMVKVIPNLKNNNYVIVTDREQAINNSVEKYAKGKLLLCWNHIRNDLKFWLRSHGAKQDDITVYTRELEILLHSETEEIFDEVYTEMSKKWSSPMEEYFDSVMSTLKTKACRWILEQYDVYNPYSGITNNIAESINAVIKNLMDWTEAPVDGMVLALYYLQNFYKLEILRGRCGVGDFKLKTLHSDCQLDRQDVGFPNDAYDPKDIVDKVKCNIANFIETTSKEENEDGCKTEISASPNRAKSTTQRSLALTAIQEKRVHLVPEAHSFIIEGNNAKYAVTINPKESCQCPSLGSCWHILAAKMSIGMEESDVKRVYNLTQLRKNNKKKPNKKTGKKQPRPCDNSPIINPAPDSVVKRKKDIESDSDDEPLAVLPETPRSISKKSTTSVKQNEKRKYDSEDELLSVLPQTPRSILKKTDLCTKKTLSGVKQTKKRLKFAKDISFNNIYEREILRKTPSPRSRHISANENPDGNIVSQLLSPVTKIDVDTTVINSPSPGPSVPAWVDYGKLSLNQIHKNLIEQNRKLDCDIINYCMNLLAREHSNMSGLQDTRQVPILENGKWIYSRSFSPIKGIGAQILHTGNDHWIVSVAVDKKKVYIYDSMVSDKRPLTNSTQIQLCKLYGNHLQNVSVRIPRVQQQTNSVDCGVFAIAFLTEFCFLRKELSKTTTFDVKSMRVHLLKCIEFGRLTQFPKKRSAQPPKRLSLTKKDIDVTIRKCCEAGCDLPDLFDDMTNCDSCQKWYHNSCVGLGSDISQSFQWSCGICC